ncbi:transposase [Paraburkholderia humisilvae]|uniref:Transposase IS200-like domain-containing protein n=1 Tax=Paraburkholderia humisilvae TaxID=627669 RepID=A0A6J5EJL6_9BURK|nr:transposase [Paraburkholderia humisilvae]CAB3765907.1 hypothetical protein LMG29542_05261 [Paraburkholderia humisilvae]
MQKSHEGHQLFPSDDDRVHLLANYPPKLSVSALVDSLKGVSSRMSHRKNYPGICRKLWGAPWSPPLFVGNGDGALIAVVRQYIKQQRTPY